MPEHDIESEAKQIFSAANRELVMTRQWTAIIEREGNGYVAFCPELDIASQGAIMAEARENLQEALELFFETASATEIQHRYTRKCT